MLHIDSSATLPPDAWERLPLGFLSPTQQALVREDLRHTKRAEIAKSLHVTPETITTYRSSIRKKFLKLPPEERPIWLQTWLRLFPGLEEDRPRGPKGGKFRAKHA